DGRRRPGAGRPGRLADAVPGACAGPLDGDVAADLLPVLQPGVSQLFLPVSVSHAAGAGSLARPRGGVGPACRAGPAPGPARQAGPTPVALASGDERGYRLAALCRGSGLPEGCK